ncbi:hypothetical protein HMPREF9318_01341 [Streptococcus urinalis FB127-CNA-2]|uniref:YigZ family protein n=1 Tax=Streptococcus urinalis 2285-97 TaxID=764291 RepID=G5KCS0_9STRE|nr:YigZ family protein [Streptococcus urinalis]EHJ57669.1 YigZ family protein [Streptococcus urinalis 2285-97]EKS19819.1 hypothetical protein HMPREF9318_01341 [Streptococcus urinalis FB127-CNA-2]VEF31395.1 Xaa-Pro dipeptidase [Streptococcus urinalis]
MNTFKTLKENSQSEIEIKKSRFITYIFRINNEEESKIILDKLRKEHYKANHLCSALVVGEKQEIKRSSDDGEPSGTAGLPILSVLEKQNLTNVFVVVVRYFDGTKLGTGGLIRAYSTATSHAIENNSIVEIKELLGIRIVMSYNQYQIYSQFLESEKLSEFDTDFTDHITTSIFCEEDRFENICHHLNDYFNGKIDYKKINSKIVEVPFREKITSD